MINITEVAKDIAYKSGLNVIILNDKDIWVANSEDIHLYNPSEFTFQNSFVAKPISQKYIDGDNFKEIDHILDNTKKYKIVLPHVFSGFQIIYSQ